MTRALSRKFHEAKARKRMALPTPDYPDIPDYDRLVKRITVESRWLNGTSEIHVLELYPARGRRDQYRVTVNGKPFMDRASLTNIFAGLRKAR